MAGPNGSAVAVAPAQYVEVHKKGRICCGMTACCLAILITVGLLAVVGAVVGVIIRRNQQSGSSSTYSVS